MPPNRKQTRSAVIVAAGLIPVVGALLGASASTTTADRAAPPVHVEVANVSPAAQTGETKPTPTNGSPALSKKSPQTTSKASTQKESTKKSAPKLPKSVRSGDVPKVNFDAYSSAEETMARTSRRCHIDWRLIAGIGRVESHHANLGDTDKDGTLITPIYGPTLDGSLAGNRVVNDTDGGRLDDDAAYDRAVGPMQFLPETWNHYAADGNGDGKADPQNIYDAALTTAHYLCDDGLDLRKIADRTTAVLRYNNSQEYVNDVLGFARSY